MSKPENHKPKEPEKQLQQQVDLFKIIIDSSFDWEVFRNAGGKILYTNDAFERITGYHAEELMNETVTEKDIVHPDDWPLVAKNISLSKNAKPVIDLEFRVIGKDKKIRHVNSCAVPVVKNGVFIGTRTSIRDITEQKDFIELRKVKKESRESKIIFQTFVENANDIIYQVTPEGVFSYISPNWKDFTGYDAEESIGKSIIPYVHPDDIHLCIAFLNKVISTGQKQRGVKYRVKHKNGTWRWHVSNGSPLKNKDGETTSYLGIGRDITEEIEIQEKIKINEELFNNVLSAIPDMVSIHDKDLNIVYSNWKGFANVPGNKRKFNTKCYQTYRGYDAICPDCRAKKVLETKKAFQEDIQLPDNTWVDLRVLPIIDNKGACDKFVEWVRVITDQKKDQIEIGIKNEKLIHTNEQLRKAKEKAEISEHKYRTIFENAPVGIFRSTREGRFIEVNQALAGMLGYNNPEEVLEDISNIAEQIFVKTENRNEIDHITPGNPVQKFENQYKKKNGKVFYANLFLREITDENGKKILEGIVEETTERKKYENKLKQAKEKAEESNRLKTAFLQNMSHEIRTPMNAITGFSGLLKKPDITKEKQNEYCSIIIKSSKQLLSIVNDVLTISALETKQEKADTTKVNLNSVLDELLSILKPQAQEHGLSIHTIKGLDSLRSNIYTDRTKLMQILSNLITNAIKFTDEGHIEFGYILKDEKTNPKLEFFVKDTGVGIEKKSQKKVFERFWQADLTASRKHGGTGLGLSISKGFVKLLGGKMKLESRPGEGSVFYFSVPYKPVVNIEKKQSVPVKIQPGKTLLIAEDTDYNYYLFEVLLSDWKVDIIRATDGKKAVEICRNNPGINLVLMDIKMPVMDGFSAAKKIKIFRPTLPIIAQSAYAMEHEIKKYSTVFDDYITKPINEEKLKKILKKNMDNRQ